MPEHETKVYLLLHSDGAPGVQVLGAYSTPERAMASSLELGKWEREGDEWTCMGTGYVIEALQVDAPDDR